ncbi:hypothetical protein HOY82DRAFT_554243, partial [Tuber indicum]
MGEIYMSTWSFFFHFLFLALLEGRKGKFSTTHVKMSDPRTNSYSRRLSDRLLSTYIQAYRLEHRTAYAFAFSGGTRL